MTATFAVVDETKNVIKQGLISHWAISAYVAELCAVLWVCITATTCVHVYTDCWAVAKNINLLCQGGAADPTSRCAEWWRTFASILGLRKQQCPRPFHVTWIPAHKLERVPDGLLTEELAQAVGSTAEHILNNRLCDRTAKMLAQKLSPVTEAS